MVATPSVQPSAPAFLLATLRAVLAELEAAHPDRASRLVPSANIVAIYRIQLGDSGRVKQYHRITPGRQTHRPGSSLPRGRMRPRIAGPICYAPRSASRA